MRLVLGLLICHFIPSLKMFFNNKKTFDIQMIKWDFAICFVYIIEQVAELALYPLHLNLKYLKVVRIAVEMSMFLNEATIYFSNNDDVCNTKTATCVWDMVLVNCLLYGLFKVYFDFYVIS